MPPAIALDTGDDRLGRAVGKLRQQAGGDPDIAWLLDRLSDGKRQLSATTIFAVHTRARVRRLFKWAYS